MVADTAKVTIID